MSMEFFCEKQCKAKKEHRCECCGRKITTGEKYFKETGKYDGEFFSRALHIQCHMMEVAYCNEVDTEFCWNSIKDYIQEEYCGRCNANDAIAEEGCDYSVYQCPRIFEALQNNVQIEVKE